MDHLQTECDQIKKKCSIEHCSKFKINFSSSRKRSMKDLFRSIGFVYFVYACPQEKLNLLLAKLNLMSKKSNKSIIIHFAYNVCPANDRLMLL